MDTHEHAEKMERLTEDARPTGAAAAVLLAAGIGSLVLGLLTTLAEVSEGLKETLQLTDPVGPLSGKTTSATVAFFLAWPILHFRMKDRSPRLGAIFGWTTVLVVLGLIMTFPPVFEAFASE